MSIYAMVYPIVHNQVDTSYLWRKNLFVCSFLIFFKFHNNLLSPMVIMSAYFFQHIILADVEQLKLTTAKRIIVSAYPDQQWAQNGREWVR